METREELTEFLQALVVTGARGRLIARGQARAIIRADGVLPADAPAFTPELDTDLADYGFSLLRAALALKDREGDPSLWRKGFEIAANAFEALIRNAEADARERGFYRTIAGAAYHLAGYSALAYSILSQAIGDENTSVAERALARLLLRDLDGLRVMLRQWLREAENRDASLSARLAEMELERDEAVAAIITGGIFKGLASFEFALATGEAALVKDAIGALDRAIALASAIGAVPLWWNARLCRAAIDDLWSNSLHELLPVAGPSQERYAENRELLIASLFARPKAQVDLWPSQIEAAKRAGDPADDLVVALPTSAGKTRVAEIAALVALSADTRVLIVTPLRALSAQTERSFRETFAPLGCSVSSLYGASGAVAGDENVFKSRHIVIATPEKLDFALRTDPSLIDDVGLIVLDEGHLIGPSDRELRYEILVQRLLRRGDSESRRIVCLSAILPDGQQLEDLKAWIRSDAAGEAVRSSWRPTRQIFGMLTWLSDSARLRMGPTRDDPWISKFIELRPPIKPRKTPFPKDTRELTLAAAWRFSDDGKRVLVYCTQRDHVEGYAKAVVDLVKRGFLQSFAPPPERVARAVEIGEEWLGASHPALACLKLGVAIHHGQLPSAFQRELERLLGEGVLRVVIASPTLAQGLNLNAAVLLIPNLFRSGVALTPEEFANVAGRAGRAYVDLEGLILHVIFEPDADKRRWRTQNWWKLVNASKVRSLQSGLLQIVGEILKRLSSRGALADDAAFEYLANSRAEWTVDSDGDPLPDDEDLVERLDAAVLGLIEALDAPSEDLAGLLEEALRGSLWARQVASVGESVKQKQLQLLTARARLIWKHTTPTQRREHFAIGLGLESGTKFDAVASHLAAELETADFAALSGESAALAGALTNLADRLLRLRPFAPELLPANWKSLLKKWVAGASMNDIGADHIKIIEDLFAYRLAWALGAMRTRRATFGEPSDTSEEGAAAACVETGLPNLMMAILVRAGLPSRTAAMAAIEDLSPIFFDQSGMLDWLRSNEVAALTSAGDWPSADTAALWARFRSEMLAGHVGRWTKERWTRPVPAEALRSKPKPGAHYRVRFGRAFEETFITAPDFSVVAKLPGAMTNVRPAVYFARFNAAGDSVEITRLGRSQAKWTE